MHEGAWKKSTVVKILSACDYLAFFITFNISLPFYLKISEKN